ncbi:MAG: O-antigen ligase family protein [Clostridia bacterium]|nr:O-antigen ligase family protein [Clostridia bacterium]
MIARIKSRLTPESIRAALMGPVYPAVIAVLVAVGGASGLEFYFNLLHTALILVALWFSKSIRPILISLVTYVMQVSVKNGPFYPNNSDFYYTGWRLPTVIVLGVLIIAGIAVFILKNKIYAKISFKSTPMLLSMLIFSTTLMTNGLFSGEWQSADIIFGFANAFVYTFVFILVYHGFSDEESTEEIAKYFAYISALIALVISFELLVHILTADNVFAPGGSIIKESMALGWGIWNLVGVSLSVLIPVIFYGIEKGRYPWLYFAAATVAWMAAVITMSRNALIFSTLAYASSVIIFAFVGKNKRAFRIIALSGAVLVAAVAVIFFDKIYTVLGDYFSRGMSDNGRFELWSTAWDNFISRPIFGVGFYGFEISDKILTPFGPLTKQAHNTVLQLLSATGITGLLAYGYYRFTSLRPVFRRPTLMKTMLAMSIAVFLGGSLLDNFVFNIYPTFYYSIALAIIHRAGSEEK